MPPLVRQHELHQEEVSEPVPGHPHRVRGYSVRRGDGNLPATKGETLASNGASGARAVRGPWLGTQHLLRAGEASAEATLAAAGGGWLDTADVYDAGRVEAFLGPRAAGFHLATKVGLVADGARYVPDGRPDALERAADASLARLGRIDLLLWHAPDPRVPVVRSARALARLREDGRVGAVGVCNARVGELRALADALPVAALQVQVSRSERAVVRSGVLEEARRRSVPALGWRPLGGRDRVRRTLAEPAVAAVAARHGVPAAAVVLAWLADLGVEPVPGSADPAHVAEWRVPVPLDDADRAALDAGTELGAQLRRPRDTRRPPAGGPRVVLIGGTPGAGKTRRVAVHPGSVRLNRDTLGGTLDGLLPRLRDALGAGRDVVLDNTYATRAQRNGVIETAWRAGARVWCEWLDTPDGEAERNAVHRLLGTVGDLVSGPALADWNRRAAEVLPPRALHRFRQEVEDPEAGEGFEAVDRIPFAREPGPGGAGLLCAPEHLDPLHPAVAAAARAQIPVLVAGWAPGADPQAEAARWAEVARGHGLEVLVRVCPHGAGPPVCWCRKPLPGLLLALCRDAGVEPSRVRVLPGSAADRTLARRLGLELAGG